MKRELQPFINFEERLIADPKKRVEYEAGLMALRFGVTVCMRREELGLKQKDMEKFGIPRETMCRLEKGDRLPDPQTQTKLAIALRSDIVVNSSGEWKLVPTSVTQKAA